MASYRASSVVPERVAAALQIAEQMCFGHSCTPEVGRLLRVLAAQVRSGRIAEIGTGCGVGLAWMAESLVPGAEIVSVELNETRATACRFLFAGAANVYILQGDWHEILVYSPFALLFADGGKAKEHEPETLLRALALGGLIVLDDLTPEELWPREWQDKPDPAREFWLNDERVRSVIVSVTPAMQVILATRIA